MTHVRLLVDDFRGCFRFYRDVIGLETTWSEGDGPYAEFRLGGDKYLGLFARALMTDAVGTGELPPRAPAQDAFALIIQVDDVDDEAERLRGDGIALVTEPADRPDWGLRTIHLRDPDGNLVELFCPPKEAPDGA